MTTTTLDRPRTLPRFGGFSLGMIRLELRRMIRNRRTVIFTLLLPAAFFLLFGSNAGYRTERVGGGNVTGYLMVSMAVYGAMIATTSGGAMVSIERAAGWSRQLRLTPLRPPNSRLDAQINRCEPVHASSHAPAADELATGRADQPL